METICCYVVETIKNNSKYIEDINELFNSVRYMYEQNNKLNLSFRYDNLGYRLYFLKFIKYRYKLYTIVQSVT